MSVRCLHVDYLTPFSVLLFGFFAHLKLCEVQTFTNNQLQNWPENVLFVKYLFDITIMMCIFVVTLKN